MLAASRYCDSTSNVMPDCAWRVMAIAMGVENQGGPAVGFTAAFPTPSIHLSRFSRIYAHTFSVITFVPAATAAEWPTG